MAAEGVPTVTVLVYITKARQECSVRIVLQCDGLAEAVDQDVEVDFIDPEFQFFDLYLTQAKSMLPSRETALIAKVH